jgi:hypothetical protein
MLRFVLPQAITASRIVLDAMSLAHAPCERFLGIDIGAETIKVAELIRCGGTL